MILAIASTLLLKVSPLAYTLVTGDFPGSTAFYGLEEDHRIVDMVFTAREFFTAR